MNLADPQRTTRRDAIKLGLLAGAGLAVGRGAPLFGEVATLIGRPGTTRHRFREDGTATC